ncbi:MAG: hypothetical protein JST54_28855 [Deltaproteobacteria bacterium]|nr:hypothetical protein [Deltaproteobacteria bacterium]
MTETVDIVPTRTRLLLCAASVLAVALPFLSVSLPPSTDLPQHLSQIRMLGETFAGSTLYRFQPFTPYGTVYVFFGLLWLVAPLAKVPALAGLVLAEAWVLAVHGLARARKRSPAAAVIASVFAFSHLVYWGFASFALGFSAFATWLYLTRPRGAAPGPREAVSVGAGALLLYFTHALWFLAGLGWLGMQALLFQRQPRRWLWRGGAVLVTVGLALAWYPSYARRAAREFDVSIGWIDWTDRLGPAWWIDALLGGVRGLLEPVTLLVLAVVALVVWRLRRGPADRELLTVAAVFIVSGLLLPDHYMNTVRFAQRYVPAGATLLALGLPAASRPTRASVAAALTALLLFCGVTRARWVRWSETELDGLSGALASLPHNARVLGLNELPQSQVLRGKPFLQMTSYAQVFNGGTTNASFCDYPHFPVVCRDTAHPWTQGLEEEPDGLLATDLPYFDAVLIQATPERHDALAAKWGFVPLSPPARWRAYRILAKATGPGH